MNIQSKIEFKINIFKKRIFCLKKINFSLHIYTRFKLGKE